MLDGILIKESNKLVVDRKNISLLGFLLLGVFFLLVIIPFLRVFFPQFLLTSIALFIAYNKSKKFKNKINKLDLIGRLKFILNLEFSKGNFIKISSYFFSSRKRKIVLIISLSIISGYLSFINSIFPLILLILSSSLIYIFKQGKIKDKILNVILYGCLFIPFIKVGGLIGNKVFLTSSSLSNNKSSSSDLSSRYEYEQLNKGKWCNNDNKDFSNYKTTNEFRTWENTGGYCIIRGKVYSKSSSWRKEVLGVLNKEITEEYDYGRYLIKEMYKIEGEELVKYRQKICLVKKDCIKQDTERLVIGYSKKFYKEN